MFGYHGRYLRLDLAGRQNKPSEEGKRWKEIPSRNRFECTSSHLSIPPDRVPSTKIPLLRPSGDGSHVDLVLAPRHTPLRRPDPS